MLIFSPTVTVVTVTVTWTLTVTVTVTVTVTETVTVFILPPLICLYYGQAGEYINLRYAGFCQDNESSDCEKS